MTIPSRATRSAQSCCAVELQFLVVHHAGWELREGRDAVIRSIECHEPEDANRDQQDRNQSESGQEFALDSRWYPPNGTHQRVLAAAQRAPIAVVRHECVYPVWGSQTCVMS